MFDLNTLARLNQEREEKELREFGTQRNEVVDDDYDDDDEDYDDYDDDYDDEREPLDHYYGEYDDGRFDY